MRGTSRQRGPGKWQIQVYAGRDETTGRDIRVTRSVAAPHTRAGKKVVDQALAALIVGSRPAGSTSVKIPRWPNS